MPELVSIVIPTHNGANFLEQAIESALEQTYPYKEVIVVDDGSTDGTEKICLKYGEKIRYFYQENNGQAAALNKGAAEMRGVWFKWLDSDDILEPNAVEELVKVAHEKSSRIVYSDYVFIDTQGKNVGESISQPHHTYIDFVAELWQHFVVNPNTTLIHKSVFDEVGPINRSIWIAIDYEFWLRACVVYGIMFRRCPKFLLRYRIHRNQMTDGIRQNPLWAVKFMKVLRRKTKQQYFKRHGKSSWDKLMKEIKKRPAVFPPYIRVAIKLLHFMPDKILDSLIDLYSSIFMKKEDHRITSGRRVISDDKL